MSHAPLANLVDELGNIRALMRQLRLREADLKGQILAARPNGALRGTLHEAIIQHSTHRRFDKKRLPDEVLADPDYWITRPVTTLKTAPLGAPPDSDGEVIEQLPHQNRK